jgi:hypothetical protein
MMKRKDKGNIEDKRGKYKTWKNMVVGPMTGTLMPNKRTLANSPSRVEKSSIKARKKGFPEEGINTGDTVNKYAQSKTGLRQTYRGQFTLER